LNQCLEGFLRCAVHSFPRQWSKWLSVAEFWYNTAQHSALGKSPFEVLYGYTPRHMGIKNLQVHSVPDLEQWLTRTAEQAHSVTASSGPAEDGNLGW
jgi:hypothetical protein